MNSLAANNFQFNNNSFNNNFFITILRENTKFKK